MTVNAGQVIIRGPEARASGFRLASPRNKSRSGSAFRETMNRSEGRVTYWLASGASLTLITSPGSTGVSSFAAISLVLPSTLRTSE